MNRDDANSLLDSVRCGDADYSIDSITAALKATGDIPTGDRKRGEARTKPPLWDVFEKPRAIDRVAPGSPTHNVELSGRTRSA